MNRFEKNAYDMSAILWDRLYAPNDVGAKLVLVAHIEPIEIPGKLAIRLEYGAVSKVLPPDDPVNVMGRQLGLKLSHTLAGMDGLDLNKETEEPNNGSNS